MKSILWFSAFIGITAAPIAIAQEPATVNGVCDPAVYNNNCGSSISSPSSRNSGRAEREEREESDARYQSYANGFNRAKALYRQASDDTSKSPEERIQLYERAKAELDAAIAYTHEGPSDRKFRSNIDEDILALRVSIAENQSKYDDALALARQGRDTYGKNANYWKQRVSKAESEIQNQKESDPNYREQMYKQKEAQAASAIQSDINSLVDNLGSGGARTWTIWRNVNGQMVEFTVLDHSGAGPSRAGEQLRGIAADDHKARGSRKNGGADASDQLQLGFDTPGIANGSLTPVVIGSGSSQLKLTDREKADPDIAKNLKEKAEAEQRYKQLGTQLKEVQRKLSNNEGDKGQLQVQTTNILNQMSAAKSDEATAVIHIQDRKRQIDLSLKLNDSPQQPSDSPNSQPSPVQPGSPAVPPN